MKTIFTIDGKEVLKYVVLEGTPSVGDSVLIDEVGYVCTGVIWDMNDKIVYIKIKQID